MAPQSAPPRRAPFVPAPDPSARIWSDRLAVWQEAIESKWRVRAELAFLRLTQVATWSYVLLVVVAWIVLHTAGDRWWAASLLLFGPRWLGLLPVLVLVPLACVMRRRLLVPIGVVTVLFVFGVLGFRIPYPWRSAPADPDRAISVLTCNVHGGAGGLDRTTRLVSHEYFDIVAFQESGEGFEQAFPEHWNVIREGGLLIASPHPISQVQIWHRLEPPVQWPPLRALYAVVDLPGRPIGVCNIHLTSPHHGLTEVLDRHTLVSLNRTERLRQLNALRAQESAALSEWIRSLPRVDILLGDFNMPVESRIYRRSWSDYRNAFSSVGWGLGYTRWVTLHNFKYGTRIDHILTTPALHPLSCRLAHDIGSDHLPLMAQLVDD